jgi:cell division protein ZapA
MAILDITINGRTHQIACDNGQEAHLHSLSRQLDERVRGLASAMGGNVADGTLLLLASLMLLDEHNEMKEQNRNLKIQIENHSQAFESAKQIDVDSAIAAAFDEMAERVSEFAQGAANAPHKRLAKG